MTDVIMPQMGESIAEGTVTKWMKNVGDPVQRDEPLFEISTDKVDAEIPAPASGVLKEIRVQSGETVAINTVVAVIAAEGEAVAASPVPAASTTPAAQAAPMAAAPTPAAPVASPAPTPAPPATPTPPPAMAPSLAPAPFQGSAPAPVAPSASPPASATPPRAPFAAPAPPAKAPSAPAASPARAPAIALPPPPSRPQPTTAAPTPAAPHVTPPSPSAAPTPSTAAAPRTPPPPARPFPPAAPAPMPAATPGPSQDAVPPAEQPRSEMTVEELRQTRSSPVVRKIAAEHQVDISQIPGTGISGRVTKQDILTHIEGRAPEAPPATPTPIATAAPPVAAAAPAAPAMPPAESAKPVVPAYRPGERVEIVPMSPIRKKTAEHMVLSKRISAHVSTVWEIDMTRVDQLRQKHRQAYEERSGVKLTYLPFIIKATIDALKAFPVLNSSVEGDSIVFKKDIHLGMAVALEWGLIVPVIRNADEKNLLGIAKAVYDLADRARTKKLKVEEIQGGTFTITNPGVFGSLFGTPIINQPQVAILGIGTIEKRPVVRDDAIAIRNMAYFALTFDHRIVDGADADRFMAHIKKGLQEFDEAAL